MKTASFALRNAKEILRDKLNLIFGIGFPVILLLLLSMIQSNIPVDMFVIDHLTPGIAVFGLSFVTLFSATLISKDRSSSLMLRLFASPLTSTNFILGYTLPMIPIALAQVVICYIVAFFLGLNINLNVIIAILATVPTSILFISIGLLCGTLFNDKQVGGLCGALLTNLTAWLSGTWFDVELVGGVFKSIADALPFIHAVNSGRAALSGNFAGIFPDLLWVIVYAAVVMAIAIFVFNRKMNADKI